MKKFLFSILFILPLISYSIDFKIGILRNVKLKKVTVSVNDVNFALKSSNNKITRKITSKNELFLEFSNGKIALSIDEKFIGKFDTLKLSCLSRDTGIFNINSNIPNLKTRSYYDDLIIFPQFNAISLVNFIDFEKYIIGVLESEVGLGQSEDFYKVHAIISRTYALQNQYKFIHEGFYLTDLVNCQVYKGNMYKDPTIINAIRATESLILVDENMDYITASYFSRSYFNNLFLKLLGLINEYLIISANPQLNSLFGNVFNNSGQIITFFGREKLPIRFLPNLLFNPVFPPIELSTIANSEDGII